MPEPEYLNYCYQAIAAAIASADTMHTARKYILDIRLNIKNLADDKTISEHKGLQHLVKSVDVRFEELVDVFERMVSVLRGAHLTFTPTEEQS